jgi:hypothetical protein
MVRQPARPSVPILHAVRRGSSLFGDISSGDLARATGSERKLLRARERRKERQVKTEKNTAMGGRREKDGSPAQRNGGWFSTSVGIGKEERERRERRIPRWPRSLQTRPRHQERRCAGASTDGEAADAGEKERGGRATPEMERRRRKKERLHNYGKRGE